MSAQRIESEDSRHRSRQEDAEAAQPSDSELMVGYANGNPRAFDVLFRRYQGSAFAYFLRRSGSPERASDLFQELFLKLHRFRARYDPTKPFAPWFFQIAHRVWLDSLRRSHGIFEVGLDPDSEPRDERSLERGTIARQETERLLGALSREEVHVVLAAKLAGAQYTEIAAHLGKSVDAARQIGSRALRRLRSFLLAEVP